MAESPPPTLLGISLTMYVSHREAPVGVGAQDLSGADAGAYTGEVSGATPAELGCRYAEVGHAERRRLFGQSDEVVAAKTGTAGSRVIYGGSAGPGLLTDLGDAVGGLFLGRFAHDPEAVRTVLDEIRADVGATA